MKYRICAFVLLLLMTACGGGWSVSKGPAERTKAERKAATVRTPQPESSAAREALLEQRITRMELQLLEKEAQVEELQARLDVARQEVVRNMAKLQSLATRAEAASGLAEAEIALQSLRSSAGTKGVPEVAQLMQLSTAEFDKQNYAGALYLANQAKGAAVAARGQLASVERGSLRAGETAFALPLRLRTTGTANVRSGPGSGFAVAFTLRAGAPMTGYSYAEQWVRITDEAGRSGWIYDGLIGRRP